MAVELAFERDTLLRLYNLLEDTSTPALVILRNAIMSLAFVIFALLKKKHLSMLDTDIAVTFCVICYRPLF
jgi:hypothetical protein